MTDTIHKFEAAGLGKAPFKVVGCYESKFQAVPGDPNCPIQPGTSCDYCATGIMIVYRIKSSDGKEFKVGCDCVLKAGDAGLKKQVNRLKTDARHTKEAAKIDAIKAKLADPSVRSILAAKPHPNAFMANKGATLLDSCEWMMAHAGNSGKLRVSGAINKALKES